MEVLLAALSTPDEACVSDIASRSYPASTAGATVRVCWRSGLSSSCVSKKGLMNEVSAADVEAGREQAGIGLVRGVDRHDCLSEGVRDWS